VDDGIDPVGGLTLRNMSRPRQAVCNIVFPHLDFIVCVVLPTDGELIRGAIRKPLKGWNFGEDGRPAPVISMKLF
jgi:hypothetical protein